MVERVEIRAVGHLAMLDADESRWDIVRAFWSGKLLDVFWV